MFCDWLTGSKHPAPHLSGMGSICIVNIGVVNLTPIETQRILVKRIVQNLCSTALKGGVSDSGSQYWRLKSPK